MKKGTKVSVSKIKNGYFVGYFIATVLDIKENRVLVNGRNGKRWYSANNVTQLT